MKLFFAACTVIVLIVLFFFCLLNISDYGSLGLIIGGLSGYGLYKIFKPMYSGDKRGGQKSSDDSNTDGSSGAVSLFRSMIFSDSTGGDQEKEKDRRDSDKDIGADALRYINRR